MKKIGIIIFSIILSLLLFAVGCETTPGNRPIASSSSKPTQSQSSSSKEVSSSSQEISSNSQNISSSSDSQVPQSSQNPPAKSGGCGGSISASGITFILALLAIGFIVYKKRKA